MNMPMSFQMPEELFLRLRQFAEAERIKPEEFLCRLLDQNLPPFSPQREEERRARVLAELRAGWAQDDAEAQETSDPDAVFRAIDADRLGDRKLFPPEMKEISW